MRKTLQRLLVCVAVSFQVDLYADENLENIDVIIDSSSATAERTDERHDYYPPTREEQTRNIDVMNQWVAQVFQRSSKKIDADQIVPRPTAPFSFVYGGLSSEIFLDSWDYSVQSSENEHFYVASYTDPKTKLRIDCEIKTYPDAAAVDWVFYLTNTGDKDSPIIENFMALDSTGLLGSGLAEGAVTLRWSKGDTCAKDAFFYHDEQLEQDKVRKFQGHSSLHRVPMERAKDYCFPFFNVQAPSAGLILAVGWTGKWKAEFQQNKEGTLTVRAGMQNTHFFLNPGERVRTPRIVLLRWVGNEMVHGHNQFRRMMLQYYTQWRNEKPAEPPVVANGTAGCWIRGQVPLNEKGELSFIDTLSSLGCEAYWLDAYWFPESLPHGGWLSNIGNWYPCPTYFPNGLKPLADAAHARGMKFVLWFIPFVAAKDTKMATEYPQYFYSGSTDGGLWNLSDPVARSFLVNWMLERKEEWGFDIWRDDGGNAMPPDDDPNRQGIAEMKYYEGVYKFLDEVLEKTPELLIDNTSGGGNRIDLEMSSRTFCQWRSDFNDIGQGLKGEQHWPYMGLADQVIVAGLFRYLPFHSGPIWDVRPYSFRSAMTSGIVFYNNLEDPDFPFDLARQGIRELKELRPYFLGDVYPLLPLDLEQNSWYAYQLDRPDLKEGCVFFFRRPESPYLVVDVTLYNIEPDEQYMVSITGETYKKGPWRQMRGNELMNSEIKILAKPGSSLLRYKQAVVHKVNEL